MIKNQLDKGSCPKTSMICSFEAFFGFLFGSFRSSFALTVSFAILRFCFVLRLQLNLKEFCWVIGSYHLLICRSLSIQTKSRGAKIDYRSINPCPIFEQSFGNKCFCLRFLLTWLFDRIFDVCRKYRKRLNECKAHQSEHEWIWEWE